MYHFYVIYTCSQKTQTDFNTLHAQKFFIFFSVFSADLFSKTEVFQKDLSGLPSDCVKQFAKIING